MLLEWLLNPIGLLVTKFINILPISVSPTSSDTGSLMVLLGKAFGIVPFEAFYFFISSVVSWYVVHVSWAVIEWIYKKIPGVS